MKGIAKNIKFFDYIIVGCLGAILAYSIFSIRLLKVCFVIATVAWVIRQIFLYKLKFYKNLIPKTFLNKAIGLFVLACLLSVIFSIDFKYSQRVFFERYLPYIAFFFLGVGIAKENLKYVKFLIGVFLLAGFVVGFGGVWDYFTLHPGRLFTSFGKKYLSLRHYFTFIAPLSVILFLFNKNNMFRIIAGLTSLVTVPCLIWNFHRGAIIAFFLSVLIISWFKNKKVFISIILILLICSFFFLPGKYINRMLSTPDVTTWGDRIPLWKAAISMWQDFPIFGVGIRKYNDLMLTYEPSPGSISRNLDHAHSTYLQILAEMGVIGLLSFLYLFFIFFKTTWRKRDLIKKSKESSIILGIIAVIIACLISSGSSVLFILLPSISSILWILFGIGVGRIKLLE